nr:hypothetical protein [Bacteroidota bacterium]
GPDPVGINGAHFWRGDETGIVNSYIDTTVLNGVKYYYALVSYDKGVVPTKIDPFFGPTGGLTPSECTKIISEDFNGTLKFVDQNCAVVIPDAEAAGYVAAKVEGNTLRVTQGIGTGSMSIGIVNPTQMVEGNTYKVSFDSTGKFPDYRTTAYNIIRTNSANVTDTVRKGLNLKAVSPAVDGIVITVRNDTSIAVIDTASGWLPGSKTNVLLRLNMDKSYPALNKAWPADYEVKFFDTNQDVSAFEDPPVFITDSVKFTITNTTSGYRCKFLIQDIDLNGKFSLGDTIRILDGYKDASDFKIVYNFAYTFRPFVSPVTPAEGDKFAIKTTKFFAGGDFFQFKTHGSRMDESAAKSNLARISVVPNPYVSTAKWERRTLYQSGRGDRKIDFTNLPPVCTIKIFTTAGFLVKTIEKNTPATNGTASWDLISDDGMEVAYGLYVFHVKAPNIGEHIGKFAVIK